MTWLSYKVSIKSFEFSLSIPNPNSPWISLLFNLVSSISKLKGKDSITCPAKVILSINTSLFLPLWISWAYGLFEFVKRTVFDVKVFIIKDISFEGEACVISISSTNILINLIKGKSIDEAINIITNYKFVK